MILGYFFLQTVLIIMHEYVHSTAAWLLGYMPTPFTVVWGNPITDTGWDEGVPYDQLFSAPGNLEEAVIGGTPLLMHAIFAAVGLHFLQRPSKERPVLFFAIYWFVVLNLTELVAYIVMRPFIPNGDTGRFNEGTGMSPWILFAVGIVFLLPAMWVFATRVVPNLYVFAGESPWVRWTIFLWTDFVMFLLGSGLRMMYLYPDPQWKVGLVGVAVFFAWVLADRFVPSHTAMSHAPLG
jgi:hypothetical protein